MRPLSGCLTVFCLLSLISDKMFPALGFGAQLPPDWKVSDARLFPSAEMGFVCMASPGCAFERSGWGPAALPSCVYTHFSA